MKRCSICGCFMRKDGGCSRCERMEQKVWQPDYAVFTQLSERQQDVADLWRAYLHEHGLLPPMQETIRSFGIPKLDDPILQELGEARDLISSALGCVKDMQDRAPLESEKAAFMSLLVYLKYMCMDDPSTDLKLLWAIELSEWEGSFVSNDEDQRMHHVNHESYDELTQGRLLPDPISSDFVDDLDGEVSGDGLARGDGLVKNLQLQAPAGTMSKTSHAWKLGLQSSWVPREKFEWSFRRPSGLLKRALMSILHELDDQLNCLSFGEGTGMTQFLDLDVIPHGRGVITSPFGVKVWTTKNPKSPVRFSMPIKLIVKRAYTLAKGDGWANEDLARYWGMAEKLSTSELKALKAQEHTPTLNNGLTPEQAKQAGLARLREFVEHHKLWARELLKSLSTGLDRVGDMIKTGCGKEHCPFIVRVEVEAFKAECARIDERVTSTLPEVLEILRDIQQHKLGFDVTLAVFGEISKRYKQALGLPTELKGTTATKRNGVKKLKGSNMELKPGETTVSGDNLAGLSVF